MEEMYVPRQHQWSVTTKKCKCHYLERSADDRDSPIEFDEKTNEYHFTYFTSLDGRLGAPPRSAPADSQRPKPNSFLVIRHCPWCGGVAPESKRGSLFRHVPNSEERRLRTLIAGAKSLDEVIERLGPPEFDDPAGVGSSEPERDGRPMSVQSFRSLTYLNLSEDADVRITDFHNGRLHLSATGKSVNSPRNQQTATSRPERKQQKITKKNSARRPKRHSSPPAL
jgi:hypothetical protein